jgi:hypothetical protein
VRSCSTLLVLPASLDAVKGLGAVQTGVTRRTMPFTAGFSAWGARHPCEPSDNPMSQKRDMGHPGSPFQIDIC